MQRIKERYADFGPTLAAECLNNEGISVSRETLRHWMCDAGIWQAGHKKPKRPIRLEQGERVGELIQIDGSTHDWFKTYGCPLALYSDRHGIFTKHDPEDFVPTQFQRATSALLSLHKKRQMHICLTQAQHWLESALFITNAPCPKP